MTGAATRRPTTSGYDERMPVPDVEFDKVDKLRNEKEMLGLYVSDHPLFGVEAALRRKVDHSVADLAEMSDGAMVHIGGLVTALSRKFTRKGDQMAVFVLEDLEASIEVTLFPRTLQEHGYKVADDVVVAVKGRLDHRDESRLSVICQGIEVLQALEADTGAVAQAAHPFHVSRRAAHRQAEAHPPRPPRGLGRDARSRLAGPAPVGRLPRRRRSRRRRAARRLRSRRRESVTT